MDIVHKNFDELFSLDNIFRAWKKFRRGKTGKIDVMDFEYHLEDNLFCLHEDLRSGAYGHSSYKHFQVFDSKKRDIHKAEVRDRVVHQIIYDYLSEIFEPIFISDSYASRIGKGQYKAINALRYFIKLAQDNASNCFVLKCDVRKYFDNIDHNILIALINEKVSCEKTFEIIKKVVFSYCSPISNGKGVPLGNITSQIFANIYLNELDQYVKKELKGRFYVRYNDDFVVVSKNKKELEEIRNKIIIFAKNKLLLAIPLGKTSIRKVGWGIDFLGFIILPKAVLLRNKTKNKIYSKISEKNVISYFGILKKCDSFNLTRKLLAMEKMFEI